MAESQRRTNRRVIYRRTLRLFGLDQCKPTAQHHRHHKMELVPRKQSISTR